MNVIDTGILIFLAFALFSGWRKGLAAMIASVAATIAAAYGAMRFAGPAAAWLESAWHWETKLAQTVLARLPLPAEAKSLPLEPWPGEAIEAWLEKSKLPARIVEAVMRSLEAWRPADGTPALLGEFLSRWAAHLLLGAFAFYVIFIALRAALRLLEPIIAGLMAPGPLALPNRILGAAAGGVQTVIWLAFIIGALSPALTVVGPAEWQVAVGESVGVSLLSRVWQAVAVWLLHLSSVY